MYIDMKTYNLHNIENIHISIIYVRASLFLYYVWRILAMMMARPKAGIFYQSIPYSLKRKESINNL